MWHPLYVDIGAQKEAAPVCIVYAPRTYFLHVKKYGLTPKFKTYDGNCRLQGTLALNSDLKKGIPGTHLNIREFFHFQTMQAYRMICASTPG